MNAPLRLSGLQEAFEHPLDQESLAAPFTPSQWRLLESFLSPLSLAESSIVYQRGAEGRSLLFLESGRITIHYENSKGKLRLSLVSPGNLFGEASFLGKLPRQATAQVASPGKAWSLGPVKFTELSNRYPDLSLAVTQLAAGVLARRVSNSKRRIAIS